MDSDRFGRMKTIWNLLERASDLGKLPITVLLIGCFRSLPVEVRTFALMCGGWLK